MEVIFERNNRVPNKTRTHTFSSISIPLNLIPSIVDTSESKVKLIKVQTKGIFSFTLPKLVIP